MSDKHQSSGGKKADQDELRKLRQCRPSDTGGASASSAVSSRAPSKESVISVASSTALTRAPSNESVASVASSAAKSSASMPFYQLGQEVHQFDDRLLRGSALTDEVGAEKIVRAMNCRDKAVVTSALPTGRWAQLSWVERLHLLSASCPNGSELASQASARVAQEEAMAEAAEYRRMEEIRADPHYLAWLDLLGPDATKMDASWAKMRYALNITTEQYALLPANQQQAVYAKLAGISTMAIPIIPRHFHHTAKNQQLATDLLVQLGLADKRLRMIKWPSIEPDARL